MIASNQMFSATVPKLGASNLFNIRPSLKKIERLSETRHYDKNRCHRIDGPIFNSKEAAEQHGLELCKSWIDKRP
jgi:hypothetical protein